MAAAYRVGLAAALSAWPVLLGRAIFYGVCLMVLVAFWDKVGSQRLAGTLAVRLHGDLPSVQWVVTGYLLALAAVLPLAGWICDRLGARHVVANHADTVWEVEAGDDAPLADIDTPADLAQFVRRP